MGKCLGFYTLRRGVFCVNCASFFSFDTMHKIDSKKRQKVLTMDKFQYFFLQFWNDKFLYFIPLLPAKNLYKKKQQQKNLWDTLMLFQFHELFSVIFWHKFCSLCMYHYDTRMALEFSVLWQCCNTNTTTLRHHNTATLTFIIKLIILAFFPTKLPIWCFVTYKQV